MCTQNAPQCFAAGRTISPQNEHKSVGRNCQQRMADERPLGRPYGAARVSRVTRAIKAGAISWRAKTSSTSPVAIAERGI